MAKRPRVNAKEFADKIRPSLEMAKKAYGSQAPDSPARQASEYVNAVILLYSESGGALPELARQLEGEISLSGLRRRLRIARGVDISAMQGEEQVVGRIKRPRGKKDPELIKQAAKKIKDAREVGGRAYGDAVREVYDDGISLTAVAEKVGVSYYSLWSAKRTSW